MSDETKAEPKADKIAPPIVLIRALAKALGIERPVRRIMIDVDVCEAPLVTVEYFLRNEAGNRVPKVISEFGTLEMTKRSTIKEFVPPKDEEGSEPLVDYLYESDALTLEDLGIE